VQARDISVIPANPRSTLLGLGIGALLVSGIAEARKKAPALLPGLRLYHLGGGK
jgi:hypothetical protein